MSTKTTVIEEYFEHQLNSVKQFGEKTLVFMEVGSFYEAYATDDVGYDLLEISKLINVSRTKKSKSLQMSRKNPYMLGFPKTSLLERLKMLTDKGFTIVIVKQTTIPPYKIIRNISGVYTPGTNILSYTSDTNYITYIYLKDEQQLNSKKITSIGMSTCDVTTGHVYVYEAYSSIYDNKKSLDEMALFVHTYNPKEIIIFIDSNETSVDYIKNYLDINNIPTKYVKCVNKQYFKLSYQMEVIKRVYKNIGMLNPIEYIGMEKLTYSIVSFILLLDYLYSINPMIIENINSPKIFCASPTLYLGNNPQLQLNIFNNNQVDTCNKKIKCLFDIVDHTSTPMGKRYLQKLLNTPFVDCDIIQNIYNITEILIQDNTYKQFENILTQINDIEKIYRKMLIGTINPYELYQFCQSIGCVDNIITLLCDGEHNKNMIGLKKLLHFSKNLKKIDNLLEYISGIFNVKNLQSDNNDPRSYYNQHVHSDVDDLYITLNDQNNVIENLRHELSSIIGNDNYVTTKHTERDGYYYNITKVRAKQLRQKLEKIDVIKMGVIKIKTKDIIFKDNISGTCKITSTFICDNSENIIQTKMQLSELLDKHFKSDINNIIENFDKCIRQIITFVSKFDYYVSNAETSIIYSYTKPLIKKCDYGFVDCKQLRHPIIEKIIDYEYVPHDVCIGHDTLKGMLLYGLNSSGKSSMMKALGISIIMAQCGMYVPASHFIYSPYHSIFTRIFGNDNIFRELSSFGVEMSELKAIWKRSDNKTLVIGDEVCRGTEQISGNSIVAATLIKLSKQNATFIFATHLHDIPKLKCIQNIKSIKSFYLSASYDEKDDKIIFDRVLKEGSGDEIYGIIVAKHIIQDDEFSQMTTMIKNEILGNSDHIVQPKQSKYNSNVYVDRCVVCGKKLCDVDDIVNLDTHHIHHQKDCDGNNVKNKEFIKKNDICNLVVLCKQCHMKHHNGKINIENFIASSNGKMLKLNTK